MDKTPSPVQITDQDVVEFQNLYKKHFGKDLDFQEARDQATKLVRLMEIVHRPITIEQYEAVKKLDEDKG